MLSAFLPFSPTGFTDIQSIKVVDHTSTVGFQLKLKQVRSAVFFATIAFH